MSDSDIFRQLNSISDERLKRLISDMTSKSELQRLISQLNSKIDSVVDEETKATLKRIRQRAYDQRKKLKKTEAEGEMSEDDNIVQFSSDYNSDQCQDVFSDIDWGSVFLAISAFVVLAVVAVFVFLQTASLYTALKFEHPALCAWGAIGMGAFFSAAYAIKKNYIAAIMCSILLIYEGLLVVAGTQTQENDLARTQTQLRSDVSFANDAIVKSKREYEHALFQYEDPTNRVFKNAWFKSKHLDPTWQSYAKAQKDYASLVGTANEDGSVFGLQGFLKVIYRLSSLVLLMMASRLLVYCWLRRSFSRS